MNELKIKVCGLKNQENITEIDQCDLQYIGFIFYEKSKRFVEENQLITTSQNFKRVGVFVNASIQNICDKVIQYNLDVVQLHGDESPLEVKKIRSEILKLSLYKFIEIWKAISIKKESDIHKAHAYQHIIDKFLFDTKGKLYGGNGQHFDWQILDEYSYSPPFLLSGGISNKDVSAIKEIKHPKLHGIDINSQFEIEPGLKNVKMIKEFIKSINKHEQHTI
ncbi:MAG: phosphoribosylanthranilate isomerase [Psychroflexus halocasei]